MKEDPSREFDMFEDARRRLARVFEGQGHDPLEAERAALYIVQGVRDVPRLIAALTHGDKPDELILSVLQKVFDGAPALAKARAVLAGPDNPALH